MLLIAIAVAELLFWVLLLAGLLARYALKAPRIGAALLVATPIVDLALLILTYVDLSAGKSSNFIHGLSAIYIGYSIALGPTIVKSLDARFAKHFNPQSTNSASPPNYQTSLSTWKRTCLASSICVLLLAVGVLITGVGGSFWLIYWAIVAVFIVILWWYIGPRREKKKELNRQHQGSSAKMEEES